MESNDPNAKLKTAINNIITAPEQYPGLDSELEDLRRASEAIETLKGNLYGKGNEPGWEKLESAFESLQTKIRARIEDPDKTN